MNIFANFTQRDLSDFLQLLFVFVFCIVIVAINELIHRGWTFRRLLRLDEWTNKHLANGRDKETISTRAGRVVKRVANNNGEPGDWKWCLFCKMLDAFDKNHCVKAYEKALKLGKITE